MTDVPRAGVPFMLRGRVVAPGRAAVMVVVNRTTDSFYAKARAGNTEAALAAVDAAVAAGADLVDIGGVRAGRGPVVSVDEEIERVLPVVRAVRQRHPHLPISVDTWRADVADVVAEAGADLINDTWAGFDPELVGVAARHNVGLVCSHTGGATPRTDPVRVQYPDGVTSDVVMMLRVAAERAVAAGVHPQSVLVDPTHDFGKNTWHSLELVRNTAQIVDLGYPVLMALSRKDFVGDSLDLEADERLEGTLAASAVATWLGAGVLRTHDARATRRLAEMIAVIRGDLSPARTVRGLA